MLKDARIDKRFNRRREVADMGGILWSLGNEAYFIPSSTGEIVGHVFLWLDGTSPLEFNTKWNRRQFDQGVERMSRGLSEKQAKRFAVEMGLHWGRMYEIGKTKGLMDRSPQPRWRQHWITVSEVEAIKKWGT